MNIKVRVKNPVFCVQILLSLLTPILAYAGLTAQHLTTWAKLGEVLIMALSNPYVLGIVALSVWNALNDTTTKGITDSKRAMEYEKPQ